MYLGEHDHVETTASGIQVEAIREDIPGFKRTYIARLDDNATIKIDIRQLSYGLITSGELNQPNGRWVLFEPERPADKILDPRLLPLIEARVEEVFRMDRKFRESKPSRFTDERGDVWVRHG